MRAAQQHYRLLSGRSCSELCVYWVATAKASVALGLRHPDASWAYQGLELNLDIEKIWD
jgi:hypothetical protein